MSDEIKIKKSSEEFIIKYIGINFLGFISYNSNVGSLKKFHVCTVSGSSGLIGTSGEPNGLPYS